MCMICHYLTDNLTPSSFLAAYRFLGGSLARLSFPIKNALEGVAGYFVIWTEKRQFNSFVLTLLATRVGGAANNTSPAIKKLDSFIVSYAIQICHKRIINYVITFLDITIAFTFSDATFYCDGLCVQNNVLFANK